MPLLIFATSPAGAPGVALSTCTVPPSWKPLRTTGGLHPRVSQLCAAHAEAKARSATATAYHIVTGMLVL